MADIIRIVRISTLILIAAALISGLPTPADASSREVLLEDLLVGAVENDIHHRAERPGRIVRVVPWMEEDGSDTVLAITEVGWVYKAADGPSSWELVGRIFDDNRSLRIAPSLD